MISTGAAVLGAGLLGAGASMWGANRAADAQAEAAAQAAAVQREVLKQNQENAQPFINNGTGASNLLASFYGLRGDPALSQNALDRFYQSPDFKFNLKAGGEALDNSAAARGGVLGGNQIRAQTEFGQGLANNYLQQYLTRLQGMSGQGIQAAGNVAGSSTVGANNIGNSLMAGGTAEASGILGTVRGFNSGLGALTQYNQLSQSSYRPSGPNYLASYNGNQIGGLY